MAESCLSLVLDLVLDIGRTQPHAILRRLDHHIFDLTEAAP
jgi:hypothetical protein